MQFEAGDYRCAAALSQQCSINSGLCPRLNAGIEDLDAVFFDKLQLLNDYLLGNNGNSLQAGVADMLLANTLRWMHQVHLTANSNEVEWDMFARIQSVSSLIDLDERELKRHCERTCLDWHHHSRIFHIDEGVRVVEELQVLQNTVSDLKVENEKLVKSTNEMRENLNDVKSTMRLTLKNQQNEHNLTTTVCFEHKNALSGQDMIDLVETDVTFNESELSVDLSEQQVMDELKLLKHSAADFPSSAKGLTFSAVIECWCYHCWNEIDPKTLNKRKISSF